MYSVKVFDGASLLTSTIYFIDDQTMRNWRNSVIAILNTRCSPYPYITPALSTLHRTHPYIRRGTIEKEKDIR